MGRLIIIRLSNLVAVCLRVRGSDVWTYIDRKTDEAVGLGSYLRINPKEGSIEVGHLKFSSLMQRTTIATEAMFLKMEYAFGLGYRRYEWKCDALNAF